MEDEFQPYDSIIRSGSKRPPKARQVRHIAPFTSSPLLNGFAVPSPSCDFIACRPVSELRRSAYPSPTSVCTAVARMMHRQAENSSAVLLQWQCRRFAVPARTPFSLHRIELVLLLLCMRELVQHGQLIFLYRTLVCPLFERIMTIRTVMIQGSPSGRGCLT